MAARAVGLATTGASLPPAASHATTSAKPIGVAASANHPLRGLLSTATSANRPPTSKGGATHGVIFTLKRNFY